MRITRYERNSKRHIYRKRVLVLFLFIVPLVAVIASFSFMSLYDQNSSVNAQTVSEHQGNTAVFKYNHEIGSKTFYRVELMNTASLPEAEDYLQSIKRKKLNGFIIKEDGYKVIYGTFTSKEQAGGIIKNIEKKAEGNIKETVIPGFSLNYNEKDNAFIQLVQAADKLIMEGFAAKSQLSCDIVELPKKDNELVISVIESGETKLERYLRYAEEVAVTKDQETLRDNFVLMLKEVLQSRLDDGNNFYKIQGGLMNQIESYRRYSEELSN